MKNGVYLPPFLRDLGQVKERVERAVAAIVSDMLQRGWREVDFKINVCRVTKSAHIKHL